MGGANLEGMLETLGKCKVAQSELSAIESLLASEHVRETLSILSLDNNYDSLTSASQHLELLLVSLKHTVSSMSAELERLEGLRNKPRRHSRSLTLWRRKLRSLKTSKWQPL